MGLKSKIKPATHEYMPTGEVWLYDYLGWLMPAKDYQPSQSTEKGKAQCWDLAEKYGLCVVFGFPNEVIFNPMELDGSVEYKNLQAAVVTAAILCALAEKEK